MILADPIPPPIAKYDPIPSFLTTQTSIKNTPNVWIKEKDLKIERKLGQG
jgi:hypothetical protein